MILVDYSEELDTSVDNLDLWCDGCQEITYQALVAFSPTKGKTYACPQCGTENRP